MLLNCGIGEDSWESFRLQGDQTSQSWRKSVLKVHWKDWCWSSNTLTTWCKELTHSRRPWCWERLKAGGEGDDRGRAVGWHHWLDRHEFEQASGVGDRQGSLVCYSPWGRKETYTTEWLNWLTEKYHLEISYHKKKTYEMEWIKGGTWWNRWVATISGAFMTLIISHFLILQLPSKMLFSKIFFFPIVKQQNLKWTHFTRQKEQTEKFWGAKYTKQYNTKYRNLQTKWQSKIKQYL